MKKAIILYDGFCVLCTSWVQWLIKADTKKRFHFVPLQSDEAVELIGEKELNRLKNEFAVKTKGGNKDSPGSVVLYMDGAIYHRSEAALRAIKLLGGIYKIAGIFLWVPRFIRDGVYKWIAANRYQWFGKRDQCYLPESK